MNTHTRMKNNQPEKTHPKTQKKPTQTKFMLRKLLKFEISEKTTFPGNFLENLEIFIKISTFLKREAPVQNLSLLEHQS